LRRYPLDQYSRLKCIYHTVNTLEQPNLQENTALEYIVYFVPCGSSCVGQLLPAYITRLPPGEAKVAAAIFDGSTLAGQLNI